MKYLLNFDCFLVHFSFSVECKNKCEVFFDRSQRSLHLYET